MDSRPQGSQQRRLLLEWRELQSISVETNITAAPKDEHDLGNWLGSIIGPVGTPFDGGKFDVNIQFPKDYPNSPTKVTMLTKIYHPNIDENGNMSIDILHEAWCPALTISKLLLSISAFLDDPFPGEDALNATSLMKDIARQYIADRPRYENVAREWTELYAKPCST